jgi:hypothetical protein
MLPQALDVVAAWGAKYLPQIVWRKVKKNSKAGQYPDHRRRPGSCQWLTGSPTRRNCLILLGAGSRRRGRDRMGKRPDELKDSDLGMAESKSNDLPFAIKRLF